MNLRKLSHLGKGTYGHVYEAIDDKTQQVYAVKKNFVSPQYINTIGTLRELDLLNLFRGHPCCVQLINYCCTSPFSTETKIDTSSPSVGNYVGDKLFLIMEKGNFDGEKFIHGWKKKPASRRKALFSEKLCFVQHIALAIEFMHANGIYHRDLKPGNIICYCNSEGVLQSAKITDFGLSQYYNPNIMSLPGFVTPWYRAPEIALMKDYNLKIDVWSFGCILFETFSHNNKRFSEFNDDSEFIQHCISKLGVTDEDYLLAKQLYPYILEKPRQIASLPFSLGYTNILLDSQTASRSPPEAPHNNVSFSPKITTINLSQMMAETSSVIESPINWNLVLGEFGTREMFEKYLDLLKKCLVIDSKKRYSISKCCNSEFLTGANNFIRETRRKFDITDTGERLKEENIYDYSSSVTRQVGMRWFITVYNDRFKAPINKWYSHEIFFHAMEMFDRFLLKTHVIETDMDALRIYINTFLFMSAKYFRIMLDDFGLNYFFLGFTDITKTYILARMIQFEEYVVTKVFNAEIYKKTIYEHLNFFVSDPAITFLLESMIKEIVPKGMSFDNLKIYCQNYIQLKQIVTPASSTTPKLLIKYA